MSPINFRKIAVSLAIFAVVAFGSSVVARADAFFTATNGSNLSASANFSLVGNVLTITLTNTSTFDVQNQAQLLTGVFFTSNGTLVPVSALLGPGSAVFFGPDGGGNVGGEWAYASGLAGAPGGQSQGISSAGLGLFGNGNFNGPDLDPPTAVNGDNYGITSAGDNLASGNPQVTGGLPLIQNQVVFTLTVSNGFTLESIESVSFHYGTALSDPTITGVPEPASMMLLGTGLLGIAAGLRRRFHKQHQV
jgi:hypothetical protein